MKTYNEEALKNDPKANFGRPYQQCAISVMDTIADPDITFDEKGICNYYYEYLEAEKKQVVKGENGRAKMLQIANLLKSHNGKYDCVLGLSGGVDSSYMALLAKRLGVNPLLVHFDYGWNSEIATKNIENIVKATGFDLYTYVMDWSEFMLLQRSYFRASVLDLDVPADHMIFGALYKTAKKFKIKYILSGNNVQTEQVLPKSWNYNKFDLVNLRNIHKIFENTSLNRLPALGVWQMAYYQLLLGIQNFNLLNLMDYNKAKIKEEIIENLGWQDYGGKHYESVFTRFYQGYVLPTKFGIDKRKAHLSNLIFSGQITKEMALEELENPTYDESMQLMDLEFVGKKLNFEQKEFEKVIFQPIVPHDHYGTDKKQREKYFKIMKSIKPITRLIKRK